MKESQKIHRPDCTPGNRSPLCYCQRRKAQPEPESTIWKDLGYESPEAYMEWLKRIASRDKPLFKNSFMENTAAYCRAEILESTQDAKRKS